MNEYIKIGQVITTHGIKGEIKIRSLFKYKEKVFKKGFKIYINHQEFIVETYRIHKGYDMLTLKDYNNINDILFLIKKEVFALRKDIIIEDEEYLDDDIINFKIIFNNQEHGVIKEINTSSFNKLIINHYLGKDFLIPYHKDYIEKIDFKKKLVKINYIEGLF